MIVDCISDLHGHYPKLEGGDLLIVAGDLTKTDSQHEYLEFREWLTNQIYKKKIFICGNHDNQIENGGFYFNNGWIGAEYLCDSGTEFEGFKIWGSPWTKTFEGMNPHCKAFTVDTDEELAKKWELIPNDVDILVTHSPPYGIMDSIDDPKTCGNYHVGSPSLMKRLKDIRPKLHAFGHIHEKYGEDADEWWGKKANKINDAWPITKYVNASHVNEHYEPVNKPIRVIL